MYQRIELLRIICDECAKTEEAQTNPEFQNAIESENSWIDALKDKGWKYCEETDRHLCPKCAQGANTNGKT